MKTVAFFNNRAGVGTTSLVYHLAHMFAEQRVPTLAVDLDPQANLSAMFLEEERIQSLSEEGATVISAIQPLIAGVGDIAAAHAEPIDTHLHLIVGDLRLSSLEDQLAESWGKCLGGDERAFRMTSAFHRLMQRAATACGARWILMDLGPNLGALTRAALIAVDHLVVPMAPDLYSIQGLENLGPTSRRWRDDWKKREGEAPVVLDPPLDLPRGEMSPLGYVVMSFGVRDRRPVGAYDTWLDTIPRVFRQALLALDDPTEVPSVADDPRCLAALRHYRSLMPMAKAAHRPMFALRTADGAIGAHQDAVRACYRDFLALARRIAAPLAAQGVDVGGLAGGSH